MQVTDVKARVAACDRIRIRVQELARRAAPFLRGLFQKNDPESEEGARKRSELERRGLPPCRIHRHHGGRSEPPPRADDPPKKGDRLTIDLTGTSPEHEGSFQALAPASAPIAPSTSISSLHDFPISAGTMEPIDFIIPHGTIMDPDPEAAISCSPITASAVFPLLAVLLLEDDV